MEGLNPRFAEALEAMVEGARRSDAAAARAHAKAAWALAQASSGDDGLAMRSIFGDQVTNVFVALGEWAEAQRWRALTAAAIAETYGPARALAAWSSHAQLLADRFKFAESAALLENLLALQVPDPRMDANKAALCQDLASRYVQLGRHDDAVQLARRNLASCDATGRDRAAEMQVLAAILVKAGRAAEAVPLAREAFERLARGLPQTADFVVATAGVLASALAQSGAHAEAIALCHDVLGAMPRDNVPPELRIGIDTLIETMADVLRDAGRHEDSARLYEIALRDFERLFGPDHPNLISALEGKAELLRRTGQTAAAEACARRAGAIKARVMRD